MCVCVRGKECWERSLIRTFCGPLLGIQLGYNSLVAKSYLVTLPLNWQLTGCEKKRTIKSFNYLYLLKLREQKLFKAWCLDSWQPGRVLKNYMPGGQIFSDSNWNIQEVFLYVKYKTIQFFLLWTLLWKQFRLFILWQYRSRKRLLQNHYKSFVYLRTLPLILLFCCCSCQPNNMYHLWRRCGFRWCCYPVQQQRSYRTLFL